MNLKDLNILYTEACEKKANLYNEKAEIFFKKKILPKILKAVKKGEKTCFIYFCSETSEKLTKIYLLNQKQFKWKRLSKSDLRYEEDNRIFVISRYDISGWQQIEPEPNDILKKNI